jgi:hypothetical protein
MSWMKFQTQESDRKQMADLRKSEVQKALRSDNKKQATKNFLSQETAK